MPKDPCRAEGAAEGFETIKYVIKFPGDYSEEATPVPIPNTAVKLFSADGTAVFCGRVGRCQELFIFWIYLFMADRFIIYLSAIFLLILCKESY